MFRYILRRLGFLVITLLFTSMIVFVIARLLPGDVARVILGREAGEAALQALRIKLGLNDPFFVQYFRWLGNFIVGKWGESFSTQSEILPLVMGRLHNTLMLGGLILLVSVPLAVTLGVISGLNENTLVDNFISITSLAVVGLPEFVTGLVLIQVFAFKLHILPANSSILPDSTFMEALPRLILPAITATLVLLAYIARLTRAGVVEELKQAYVRTADLKGLPRRTVVIKHILRNALMPTITVIAISCGWLISGLIVIENVFNYPGLGRLMLFAIDRRDLPLLQAVTMLTVIVYALANLIADILYAILNPKIRLGSN